MIHVSKMAADLVLVLKEIIDRIISTPKKGLKFGCTSKRRVWF